MSKYKAICCDMDGTLLTGDKRITQESKKWISKVVNEKGVRFVIVSGRMLYGVRKFYSELGITGPASCCNGTCLFDENDKLVQDYRISGDYLERVVHTARKFNLGLIFISGDDWFMESRDSYSYKRKIDFYFKDCLIENFDDLIKKCCPNKMVVMHEDFKVLEKFEKELRKTGLDDNALFYYPGEDFLEMMPAKANKSFALDALSASYGISAEEIVAIGDDYNDVEMIKKAGLGVAMANAKDAVKNAADYITLSNEEDGVAFAIKKIFFE